MIYPASIPFKHCIEIAIFIDPADVFEIIESKTITLVHALDSALN